MTLVEQLIASAGTGGIGSAIVYGITKAVEARSKVDIAAEDSDARKVEARADVEEISVRFAHEFAAKQQDRADKKTDKLIERTEEVFDCRRELAEANGRIDGLVIRLDALSREHANCPGKSQPPPPPQQEAAE